MDAFNAAFASVVGLAAGASFVFLVAAGTVQLLRAWDRWAQK